ncbi:MAG TPA: 6-phospho-beta-glucosidase [Pseudonocardiaceae bacterium]|nr:6-phospho-beta-glucosidase [Pseudonocardiaceae bacterium]
MRLTILGGGGFRVPLVYAALLRDHEPGRITEVVLHDVDPARLSGTARVLAEQAAGVPDAPEVTTTADLDAALRGADFVFSAIRVGGTRGRVVDERVALAEGVLGQETVGAGGIAYGLRTVPVARRIAARVAELAPEAWVINFTNPAGMVTEAMAELLGRRVIGICDSPLGLCRRLTRAYELSADARFDYAGLNHLGWVRAIEVDGHDVLPKLLADPGRLTSFEEGALFGADWLRTLGSLPNEYLYYYYFNRESVAAATAATETRGAFLARQQDAFYTELARPDAAALEAWQRARLRREETYMAENRAGQRAAEDLESGGYQDVALALMRAIAHDEPAELILNIRNGSTVSIVDGDAVVEVPCTVDGSGVRSLPVGPFDEHQAGLVCAVKAVERDVIEAARTGSREAARRAFACHPLIDSAAVAQRLLESYVRELPGLAYLRP